MKHADKNVIDILLRGLAKNRRRATGVDNEPVGEHLDADELNSFAEDALPAATRARYTAHLADCSNCRKQAANLAVAAGIPTRDAAPVTETKSFWQRLSPIFSPPVLKYALPALVLTVLIGASLFMVRRSENEFVAQRSNSAQTPAGSPQNNQSIDQQYGATDTAQETAATHKDTPASATAASGQESTRGQQAASAASPMNQTDTTSAPAQPSYAPEVAAEAPPPPTKPKEVSVKQAEEADSAKTADAVEERRIEAERQKKKDQSDVAKNEAAPAAGGITVQRAEKLPTASRRAQIRSDSDEGKRSRGRDGGETRSVAGRSFTRDGDAWIDAAFSSSMRVVSVRRGSEQFRALVADEPGLKTISDALSGTVIAVWKGRAYRIE